MATATNLSAARIGGQGGDTLIVELSTSLNIGDLGRIKIVKLADRPPTYTYVGEALNGRPGETELGDANETIYHLTPYPDTPTEPKIRRFLRAYAPRLAPGIYYLQVEVKAAGTYTWELYAVATPGIRVLRRLKHQEVYAQRQLYPTPPFAVGPKHLNEDPIVTE